MKYTEKAIAAAINEIGRAGATVNERVQEVACCILEHAAAHHDYSKMRDLYVALNRPNRAQLMLWLRQCSPLVARDGTIVRDLGAKAPAYNPAWARANPWHAWAKPAADSTRGDIDAAGLLKTLDGIARRKSGVTPEAQRLAVQFCRMLACGMVDSQAREEQARQFGHITQARDANAEHNLRVAQYRALAEERAATPAPDQATGEARALLHALVTGAPSAQ